MSDQFIDYGDTGSPSGGDTNPTGQGLTRGIEVAGQPGTPLPGRVQRAAANNAKRTPGYVQEGDMTGKTEMEADVPWR